MGTRARILNHAEGVDEMLARSAFTSRNCASAPQWYCDFPDAPLMQKRSRRPGAVKL